MKISLPILKYLMILIFAMPIFCWGEILPVQVKFEGVQNVEIIESLQFASELERLANRRPLSSLALKNQAEGDVENLIKVLHGFAYYDAKINLVIENSGSAQIATYMVETGPQYPLADFRILNESLEISSFPFDSISLDQLGIVLGALALPKTIVTAEELLLEMAADKGYPQFAILRHELIADQQKKVLTVILHVDSGPLIYFGKTTILGHSTVAEDFLTNKVAWSEGERFNLQDIAKTQTDLERSGLFSSVSITYQSPEEGEVFLPLEIQLIENKHRTVGGGVSYTTQRGPGMLMEWEHRNVGGMGQRINFQGNIWKDTQEAKFTYLLPDFGQLDQNLIWQAALEHENLEGYSESSISLSGLIDRKISANLKISYGLEYKSIRVRHSDDNGDFNLLKIPLQLRWSTANSLLDPTDGHSLNLKVSPTLQILSPYFAYCPATLAGTYYLPLTDDHRVVFAAKATIGSIFGASRHDIPPSERFYAGGENSLRGYRYQTVSPLNKNKPIGGRSLMTLSLEARFRLSEKIGLVGFYEVGNVYGGQIPQFNHKQLQSVGVGLRYHTPIGPIRLDVAMPLNPRKGIDSPYQIYMSIGQSF